MGTDKLFFVRPESFSFRFEIVLLSFIYIIKAILFLNPF